VHFGWSAGFRAGRFDLAVDSIIGVDGRSAPLSALKLRREREPGIQADDIERLSAGTEGLRSRHEGERGRSQLG